MAEDRDLDVEDLDPSLDDAENVKGGLTAAELAQQQQDQQLQSSLQNTSKTGGTLKLPSSGFGR